MKFYFVRHGESILNAKEIHQTGETPLSEKGHQQAKKAGKRFANVTVDSIISSPYERAKQTAESISTAMSNEIIFSSLFVELKRPSELHGRSFQEPEVIEIKKTITDNWHDPEWRHSDEETFYEFRDRGVKALSYLVGLQNENTLVVTHGEFLKMLVTIMLYGDNVEAHQFQSMRTFLKLNNTGVSICEYENGHWSLISWNDHSHL